MAGGLNYTQFEDFTRRVEQGLGRENVNAFMVKCAKELAARILAKAIKKTPVGQYPKRTGKKGGTLRRGWTGGTRQASSSFSNGLDVVRTGDTISITISNQVEYASYVEYGHRTRNHRGWVDGRFMLTLSVQEVQNITPTLLEQRLRAKLREVLK